jgi:hypothetical protein
MSIFNSYVSLPEGNFWERLQRFLGDVPGELASQWFETGCLPLIEKHQKVSQPWLSWLPKWTTSPGTQHELLHSSPGTTQNPYSIGNQHETCLTYLGMKIWQVKNLKPPSSNRSHVKNVARRVLVVGGLNGFSYIPTIPHIQLEWFTPLSQRSTWYISSQ